MFESCESYLAYTMKGLNLISFSMPKHQSTLMSKAVVPVVAILHGTHEISLHTVQAMFGRIKGFQSMWTPIFYGPGTLYKAFEDHVMYKTFLDTSSTLLTDPITQIRVETVEFNKQPAINSRNGLAYGASSVELIVFSNRILLMSTG